MLALIIIGFVYAGISLPFAIALLLGMYRHADLLRAWILAVLWVFVVCLILGTFLHGRALLDLVMFGTGNWLSLGVCTFVAILHAKRMPRG